MLRPTPIRRYLTVMTAKGYAIDEVVKGAGLDIDALDDPQYLIDAGQYRRVVENMIELAGDEGLGLSIGLQRDVKDFGILGYAALSCRSVRHSVEEFWGRYGDALGMMAKIAVPRGNAEALTVDIVAASISPAVDRFFIEEALCLLLKVGAQVSGVEPRFARIHFSFAQPHYAKRYEEIFHCPVKFGAGRTRATPHGSWFEMPLKTSDPELVRLYTQHLVHLQHQIETSDPITVRLRSLFVRNDGKIPPLDTAANQLGLSPRTLRRQLQLQGQCYRKLSAEFRKAMSLDQLRSGGAATKMVSRQAGFEDVNAFRRAFKKWTGKTISEYRTQSESR